jgi:hypothetical protein
MQLEHEIIEELFSDSQFVQMLIDISSDNFDSLEELFPAKWKFSEDRYDMDKDSVRRIEHLKKTQSLFAVNTTGDEDTNFSFLSVEKQYGDLLIWVLDKIKYNWSPIEDFHPDNYEEYNKSENDMDNIYDE